MFLNKLLSIAVMQRAIRGKQLKFRGQTDDGAACKPVRHLVVVLPKICEIDVDRVGEVHLKNFAINNDIYIDNKLYNCNIIAIRKI